MCKFYRKDETIVRHSSRALCDKVDQGPTVTAGEPPAVVRGLSAGDSQPHGALRLHPRRRAAAVREVPHPVPQPTQGHPLVSGVQAGQDR